MERATGKFVAGSFRQSKLTTTARRRRFLSYDVSHAIPWDWRVSLYTWTKGIASGVYLVAALLVLFGVSESEQRVVVMGRRRLSRALSRDHRRAC